MPNIKLCILITYLFLGPSAPWAHDGRPACPPSKPALVESKDGSEMIGECVPKIHREDKFARLLFPRGR
jgi:hypothetical protein